MGCHEFFSAEVEGPQRLNPDDFGDPLTYYYFEALQEGQSFSFLLNILAFQIMPPNNFNDPLTSLLAIQQYHILVFL